MPSRLLKESIKRSEDIDALNWFEEVLFYRLIVSVDDFGRYDGRAVVIKNELFPTKENITRKSVEDAISKLASVGLVALYEVNGKQYLRLPTWELHQRVRNSIPKYPAPDDSETEAFAASRGELPQVAADSGEPQQKAAVIQSNPIQSESESIECVAQPRTAHAVGEHGYVKLTEAEHERLIDEFGEPEVKRVIAYVDESAATTNNKNKWRNWNLVLRKAIREGWGNRGRKEEPRNDTKREYTGAGFYQRD